MSQNIYRDRLETLKNCYINLKGHLKNTSPQRIYPDNHGFQLSDRIIRHGDCTGDHTDAPGLERTFKRTHRLPS